MPTEVEIPDVGIVEFPDSMSEDEIADTIRYKILRRPSAGPAPLHAPGESQLLAPTTPSLPTQAFPVQQDKVESAAQFRAGQEQKTRDMAEAAQAGTVTPAQIGVATSTLPKVTAEEVATLLPKGTPSVIPKVAAGLQQGIVSVPEGFMNEWGAAAVMAGPLGKGAMVSKAIGKAFIGEMAASIPKQATEVYSAFRAGDVEGGTRALAALTATSLFVGAEGAKVVSKELAARRTKQLLGLDPTAGPQLARTAEALTKTTEAKDAIQERISAPVPVEAPPKIGAEVGAQVRPGQEPALPQKPSEQPGEQVQAKEPLGNVNKPSQLPTGEVALTGELNSLFPGLKGLEPIQTLYDEWTPRVRKKYEALPKEQQAKIDKWFAENSDKIESARDVRDLGAKLESARFSAQAGDETSFANTVVQELISLSRWTGSPRYRQLATDYMRGVLQIAKEAGFNSETLSRKFSDEMRATFGADAQEMATSIFGESNKLAPATPERAPQTAAPAAAAVSEAKSPGVAAPEVPPAIREATTPVEVKQTAPTERAVTKAKTEIQSVAKTEGPRPAKEVKTELVERIEKAIEAAPNEADVMASSYTKANMERVETPDRAESITIEIPGDGTFKIRNTKEALTGVLERAKRISTSVTPKASIPRGAIKSSGVALEKQAADKAEGAARLREAAIGQQRLRLYDDINKSDTEGLIGRTEPEPSVSTEGQTVFKEWRLRKATSKERQDFYKSNRYEIRWIGENRRVTFSQGEGRKESEWDFNTTGKTRADAMRTMVFDSMPKESLLTDPGAKSLRDLEYGETAPAKPEIVGMGGAVPSEFQPSLRTATGIKNAAVDAQRAERGLEPIMKPARVSQQEVWNRTMAKIDRDPMWQDNLIAELKTRSRNLSDEEILALEHRMVDLKNEFAKATRDGDQAMKDGRLADVEDAKARVAEWETKLAELELIARSTGSEWGKSGSMRQRLLREDYTLENMERRARAAKGFKPLTEAERAEFVKKDAELRRIEAELKDKDQALAQAQMARTIAEMEAATAKQQATIPPQIQRIITRVGEVIHTRANAARERLKGKLFTLSPEVLKDLAEVGADNIFTVGMDFAKWSGRMVKDIGDHVKPHLETVWKESVKLFDKITDQVAGRAPKKDRKRAADEIKKPKTTDEVLAETITKVREGAAKEDADINALARKLARAFYKDGVRDREALIDAVHSVLEPVLPDWSRRQSMDAISGYGTVKPLTKDEVSVALRDLKGQMQQLAKLEDMASGNAPLKTGIELRIPSEVEKEIIKQVNERKRRGEYVTTDPNTQLKSALDTVKTRTRNQIAELERRLREKDFSKKTKEEIQLDKEALDLQYRRKKVKDEVDEKVFEMQLANATIGQKAWSWLVERGNMIRAFQTSGEFSAVLRQGKFIVLTHPVRAAKSLKPMFEAFASEKGAFKVQQEIENRPNYPIYQKAKLFLSERGGPALSRMEEEYRSRAARNLPIVGPIIKGSERAYTTLLNKLRADSFDAMASKLSRTSTLTLNEAKVLANFINVWTGRGTIAMAEHAGGALNATFFAPRFVASRFQTLLAQPIWYGAVSGKVPLSETARVRRMIATEYAKLLGAYATIYTLVQASDMGEVGTESTSSDFGKIIIGNTRIDILAGLSQNTVLLSRVKEGKTTSVEGKESIIRGKVKYGEKNAADIIARFLRTKLAPVPALVVDIASGTDVTGDDITPASLAKRTLVPITYQDILTVMEDQGVPRGVALQVLGIFGESVDTYTK